MGKKMTTIFLFCLEKDQTTSGGAKEYGLPVSPAPTLRLPRKQASINIVGSKQKTICSAIEELNIYLYSLEELSSQKLNLTFSLEGL